MTEHNTAFLKQLQDGISTPQAKDVPDFIPADSPFDEEQRIFLNGLFSGIYAISTSAASQDTPGTELSIFFGSQSGTGESLSKELRKFAATQGFDAQIAELDSITPADLAEKNHVLIIAATFGEGDPTDNATKFCNALLAEDAPILPATLNFSVCGLGDSSYAHFNKTGRDIDARLSELGATRAAPFVACDVDYDDSFASWRDQVFQAEVFTSAAGTSQAVPTDVAKPGFDKNHPFIGTLLDVRCLNSAGSAKTVNHVEISLAGGGTDLDYKVGDALGLWPLNDPTEVQALLYATGLNGTETVMLKTGPSKLRAALLKTLDLTTLTPDTSKAWGFDHNTDAQVIDVLKNTNALTAQMLVDGLRPLQPRLYSISSSPNKHPGEVHLTVGEVHYERQGTPRKGVTSTYLGQRLQPGASIGVYVQKSGHFHLPVDDSAPLIMIGPGTGIAPFRAFLEEREMRQAQGPNWLFFGDQHEATDFLYRDEITGWQEAGLLTETSLAWSRDGTEKVYVQHLIQKQAAQFYDWLENGAAIFVCGDATRMAVDVDTAIRDVICKAGKKTEDECEAYLNNLKSEGRYQRDVY